MNFKEDVKKHMENEYPETHQPKKDVPAMKTFEIHVPEQTFYITAHNLEEARDEAICEYGNLHDEIKEINKND